MGKLSAFALLASAPASLVHLLLAALGLVTGLGLLLTVKWAARLMTPDDPAIGMAKVLLVNTAVMGFAIASLAAVFFFARAAIAFFGIALVSGFLVAASVELFRFGGLATGAVRRR